MTPPLSYIFIGLYFELEKLREEVHALAITDELTRVFNRRHFIELAEYELERAKRYRHALSLIIFDIDNFKKVNDKFGHLCGDVVLQELSLTCRTILRQCDTLARFGGEEFIERMIFHSLKRYSQYEKTAALLRNPRYLFKNVDFFLNMVDDMPHICEIDAACLNGESLAVEIKMNGDYPFTYLSPLS